MAGPALDPPTPQEPFSALDLDKPAAFLEGRGVLLAVDDSEVRPSAVLRRTFLLQVSPCLPFLRSPGI